MSKGLSKLWASKALFLDVPLSLFVLKRLCGGPRCMLRGVPVDENLKSWGIMTEPLPPPTRSPSQSRSSKRAIDAIAIDSLFLLCPFDLTRRACLGESIDPGALATPSLITFRL